MSRHIKSAHTITQDDDNFMLVLSKKSEIKCKICNVIFLKTYNLKGHMNNEHEGYDSNKPNNLHQYLDKRMRIGNYTVKNLESEAHGKK